MGLHCLLFCSIVRIKCYTPIQRIAVVLYSIIPTSVQWSFTLKPLCHLWHCPVTIWNGPGSYFSVLQKGCRKEASLSLRNLRELVSGWESIKNCEVVFQPSGLMFGWRSRVIWVASARRSQYSICSSGANAWVCPRRVTPVGHGPQSSFLQAWNHHTYPSKLSHFPPNSSPQNTLSSFLIN